MSKRKLKKKYKIFSLIIALLIIIISVCIYFVLSSKTFKIISIEYGETIPKTTYIIGKKCNINWKNIKNNIGSYSGNCNIYGVPLKVELNIGDTTSPEIIGVKNVEIQNGEELDLLKDITIKDESKVDTQIIGDYDLNEDGEYNLIVKSCDIYLNCSEEEFVLTVSSTNEIKPKYIDGVLIVNKTYPVPSDYEPENLVYLNEKGYVIDYVKEAYLTLENDAKEEGLNIYSSTAYRSYAFQSILYNNYVARDGKEKADTFSARPGYSEHHTGLAIDLNTVNSEFNDTNEAKWLADNCYKYGFIIRYPKGKEEITGYKYESWHIRYVGKELAKKLYNEGNWITLEEHFNIKSEYKD